MKDAPVEIAANVDTETLDQSSGYTASRMHAVQKGILSRHAVQSWEDAVKCQELLKALTLEHSPTGLTEQHLVGELAGVIWRKHRLRLAKVSNYHRALHETTSTHSKTADAALISASSDH